MLISVVVALIIVLQDWHHVEFRSAGWLLASTVAGIAIGVLLLARGNHRLVTAALGIVIVAFAFHALFPPTRSRARCGQSSLASGLRLQCGDLRRRFRHEWPAAGNLWSHAALVGTALSGNASGILFAASVLGLAGYIFAGLWVPELTRYFLFSLPGTVLAILLGGILNRKLRGDVFVRYVYAGLVAVGTVLVVQAVRG